MRRVPVYDILFHLSNMLPAPKMQLLLDKIGQLDIGWNERLLGESDLYELCDRFNLTVDELPLNTAGFYYRVMGSDHIAINSKLAGPIKLSVLFHEFAHFLFHTSDTGPAVGFHGVGRQTRKEREADVFAICAVIPRPLINGSSIADLLNDGYPAEMITERLEVLRRYGI
jgi:Zn-dependent peptidase ImmA (M78 family)